MGAEGLEAWRSRVAHAQQRHRDAVASTLLAMREEQEARKALGQTIEAAQAACIDALLAKWVPLPTDEVIMLRGGFRAKVIWKTSRALHLWVPAPRRVPPVQQLFTWTEDERVLLRVNRRSGRVTEVAGAGYFPLPIFVLGAQVLDRDPSCR